MELTKEARSIFIVLDKYLQYREQRIGETYTTALELTDEMHDKWNISDSASDFCKDILARTENLK